MHGLIWLAACLSVLPFGASGQEIAARQNSAEDTVRQLARELSAACPLADPKDQTAFDACRQALFRGSLLRQSVGRVLLWGRPDPKPGTKLEHTVLTQFGPEVWTGLYAPLFMFDGTWSVRYDDGEKLHRAELGALFRNGLAPGQYPYPFWHSAKKWNAYQNANALVLWLAPQSYRIVVGQFINDGRSYPRLRTEPVTAPVFDGQWMWTDARGDLQPAPTLFRGLFSPANPYLRELEPRYRDLAEVLRKGRCNACHVPENPDRLSRLVLLQTPAHAASEIKRIMRAVRDEEMPVDDTHLYREIDPDTRAALLDYGGSFEEVVDAARAWEEEHR
jgi:hypothetical protein